MQLKFKKIFLLSTVIIYFVSFVFQSNLGLFQALAQSNSKDRVNIVAILVDANIYVNEKFNNELKWYATEYVQRRLTDTKALVLPLDLENIHAYDIYRMMENIYFDGLENVNSSLLGLIMFGDIPMPVVNQNGYIFPTVYPYVDFENQKYVWNNQIEYFVPNGNTAGQAEIWHGLINYGTDIQAYLDFFDKLKKYDKNPDDFVGDAMWYDDFISQKKGFLDNNFPYYRNRIMFAEDLGYQRYSPLMKKIFEGEQLDTAADIVSQWNEQAGSDYVDGLDLTSLMKDSLSDSSYTTKMVQQEIENGFLSDYNDLFSQVGASVMRENIFAGGRWIKEYKNSNGEKNLIVNSDSTMSKIQLKDDVILGNENMQGLIENLNDLMEEMIDKKIEEKKLSMDIVIPLSYKKVTKKRITFVGCRSLIERYENYYFGNNARFVDKAEDLSVYRGTYRNLSSLSGVTYSSLLAGKNSIKSNYDNTDLKLKSIGGSYDIFSMQVEGNRGYNMFNVEGDLDTYDENKTQKNSKTSHKGLGKLRVRSWPESCDDNSKKHQCENLFDFAKRRWGGASPINLDSDSVSKGRYSLSGYVATDSWRPIFGMDGFQSLLTGDDEGSNGKGWKDGKGKGPQWDGTNYKAYIKYASPTQREGWKTRKWAVFLRGYEIFENYMPDVHDITFNDINYRNLSSDMVRGGGSSRNFSKTSNNVFTVGKKLGGCRGGGSIEYSYKVISSVVKHDSTNEDQINGIDRDKYGEDGQLGKYYKDVMTEYEDLRDNMNSILDTLSGLAIKIASGNDYINEKFSILPGLINKNPDLASILELTNQLSGLEAQLSGLKLQLSLLENQDDSSPELEIREDLIIMDEFGKPLDGGVDNTDSDEMDIEEIKQSILELEQQIELIKSEIKDKSSTFQSVLDEVSEYIKFENTQLLNVYELLIGLYTDNLLGALEFIAYVEGGNPEDYTGFDSVDLVKVGFLPSWISNINNISVDIRNGENRIISGYDEIYLLIQDQQESWFDLAEELKKVSGVDSERIDKITEDMNQILTIVDDGKTYDEDGNEIIDEEDQIEEEGDEGNDENGEGDEKSEEEKPLVVVMYSGTAVEAMENFDKSFGEVSVFFSNLIEKDKVGPAIISLAQRDPDFARRLRDNSVNYKEFTDVDRINQYARWAKGPGYDKNGPKENQDLLLGVTEHMSGINLLTPDRPIDSPRYVSMQSVAGNEVKFIYPDLFKVEVYKLDGKDVNGNDVHQLLTSKQIKENLIKYLKGKVDEYNRIIKNECTRSLNMNNYYWRLREMSYFSATPNYSIHSCGNVPFKYEDFVEALGGEGMLDTISEVLYYQSITNKRKLSTGDINQDINFVKESFGLNDKRAKVLEDYLVEGNEKVKNSVFEIPTYEPKGYEVGFINSDGRDYIFPLEEGNDGNSQINFDYNGGSYTNETENFLDDDNDGNDDECDIPLDGRLPLFALKGSSVSSPWLKGFECWLKKTLKTPAKVKLSFDNSLGEVLSSWNIVKNTGLKDTFTDRGDSWDNYIDEWDAIILKKDSKDSDNVITQMQIDAQQRNQEKIQGKGDKTYFLSSLYNYIKIENSNLLLSNTNPSSNFKISSVSELGNIKVVFKSTGDGCLKINSNDLCDGKSYTEIFNPKTKPFSGLVTSSNHVAGKVGLIVEIGVDEGYIENVIKYTVGPSTGTKIDIEVKEHNNSVLTVAGMMLPMKATLYDIYNNKVSWGLENYKFVATTGTFLKDGGYQTSFETNDFRNLDFYYQAPLNYQGQVSVQVLNSTGNVLKTIPIQVVKANLETKFDGISVLSGDVICYKLGGVCNVKGEKIIQSKDEYEKIYSGGKLNVSKLHKLDVEINDVNGKVVDVDSQILVSSQNGLLVFGQVSQEEGGENTFIETSKFSMVGGHVTLYYYPKTSVGEDKVNIDIPGFNSRVVVFDIKEGVGNKVRFNLGNDYVKLGGSTNLEIFLYDQFGNPKSGTVGFSYDADKIDFFDVNNKSNGNIMIQKSGYATVSLNGYLKTKIVGIKGGKAKIWSDEILEFNVDGSILPTSGLNTMYLNYFGNDWGNQWGYFSDNNKYVESLMKNSDKIITTTTQLVSENKIKRMLWSLNPGFRIKNFDNIDTIMTIVDAGKSSQGKKLVVKIGGLTTLSVNCNLSPSSFKTLSSLDDVYSWLKNSGNYQGNYIFFVPNSEDYSINDKGELYNLQDKVGGLLNGEITLRLNGNMLSNGENLWSIVDKGIDYGNLILYCPNYVPKITDFVGYQNGIGGEHYVLATGFSKGSTDIVNVGIFDLSSDFELDSNYKSIQNSDDMDEKIGFLGDFKNITLFGQGEIVGEATKKFGSELLINLGDPILSRKSSNENVYGTDFDGGIGQEIYSDSENDIFGTYQIDFDKNGSKDLLVVYLDGTFKLIKNYDKDSSKLDLRNMQELMRLAVYVKDVFVGDADGNGYEDVFVYTDNNQIRVFLNNGGKFDVDGNVVCLNQNVLGGQISTTPSNMEGMNQFFVEDMDLDGVVDIITYDAKGYIKVFYGGSSKNGVNYLSNDKYACDSGWYDRQSDKITVVTALGVQIATGEVYDDSMMYWRGISKPNFAINDLTEFGINIDPDSLEKLIKPKDRDSDGSIEDVVRGVMDDDKFDVATASKKFIEKESKYSSVTLYENTLIGGGESGNYLFVPIGLLDATDPCKVSKKYRSKRGGEILMDGDIVTVTVTVKATNGACIGAYGDVIKGPWNIYYDEKGIMKGIKFRTSPNQPVVKSRDGKFAYLIDNIILSSGQQMIYEYDLEYHHVPLGKMSITYETFWSNDKYPDIKLQSVNGCVKDFEGFVNSGRRFFERKLVPLQSMIDAEYIEEDSNTEDYAEDVINNGSNVNDIPGIIGDKLNRVKIIQSMSSVREKSEDKKDLQDVLDGLNMNFFVDLSVLDEQTEAINNLIDDMTKGMCNGFSFGGSNNCKGLPVPFNQAFLAPGKYHLFGCWNLPMGPLEGGLPTFFFPGTLPTPFGPIPFPWGLKNSIKDRFIWAGGGTYTSFIRIYTAPTLTAQLGVAICMGPYMDEYIFPSPLADVAGNCIVIAVKPQCKNDDTAIKKDKDNPNEIYDEIVDDVKNSGVCNQSQQSLVKGSRSTPFNLYSFNPVARNDVIIPESEMDDVLDEINKITGLNAENMWKDALKGRIKIAGHQINLSLLDTVFGKDTIDKLYNQYFADAKMTVANPGYSRFSDFESSFLGIVELDMSSYVGVDDSTNTKNSFFIGDVDVLGGDFKVNKIKGGIQQGIRSILIDKWLDPQIRYIANQLTKMHINVKLPDVGQMVGEFSSIKDVAQGNQSPRITGWASNNFDNLESLNNTIAIANPFESLASLLNQSNIVNISVEPITVKVPRIFAEDISAYKLYLNQWLEVNNNIINQWSGVLNSLVVKCGKIEDDKEKQECYNTAKKNLDSFVEFTSEGGDWTKMQNQIYANLNILQQYRNFPFEVYERIHAIDRYISEIISLISNTIGYLSYWTTVNSERFVGYVDAIILVMNIIRTYQIIPDFSTEWSRKCGTCARDTYDQYSCKLSLLCGSISLPIIQIPNFKLPNITIDLSNIDLGLDIILPTFNFQPVKVILPDLPNLPEPPSIGVDIRLFDLPDIPLLPEPPELPELPSFIPEIEIELPVLPPAPELPRLPNSIEGIIKFANIVGKIYCIVKGKFGLVGESSVKAKIEQLTQRTYDVNWIDDIMDFTNRNVAPVHNYGLDYEISSYVDLQFNFSSFYTYLDTLTKSINSLSTSLVRKVNTTIDDVVNNEDLIGNIDSIDGTSIQFDLDLAAANNLSVDELDVGLLSDDIEYTDYYSAKSRLQEVLAYFRTVANDTTFTDSLNSSISKIENQINRGNVVEANLEGIEQLEKDVISYLNNEKMNYDKLADLINNDYDGFLAMVDSQSGASDLSNGKLLTFNVQLFNVDSSTEDNINSFKKMNPYEILLDNKKEIINGYRNAVSTNTAETLGLTNSQYLVMRENIGKMKNQVTSLYSFTKPVSSTKLISKNSEDLTRKTLLSATDSGPRLGSNMELAEVVDPSALSNGIYEKIKYGVDAGKLTKVVNSDSFVSLIGNKYKHISRSGDNHDIILWNEKSIFVKCRNQECSSVRGIYKKYYKSNILHSIPYEEKWIDFDSDTKLKISDVNDEVKNWKVIGQTYDNLSFSWKLENVDGYLIDLTEKIDYNYEKNYQVSPIYVLALPKKSQNLNDLFAGGIKLELINNKIERIEKLYGTGKELVQLVYYDDSKDLADIILSNVDRKWYYARVATLNLLGDTYYINSPWSNQIVAGKQILGDDIEPEGNPVLYRPSMRENVAQGIDLEGYVGTKYELRVDWSDNVALSYINLSKDGKILDEKYTSQIEDSVSTVINIHTKEGETEIYNAVGIDQFGNKAEKVITVSYSVPEISITDVLKNPDGKSVSIEARLSQDIDQGNVSFQRKRGNAWKTMRTNDGKDVDVLLSPGLDLVSGLYSAGNEIAIYDKNEKVIALMNPETAEIKFQAGYDKLYGVRAVVEDSLVLQIYNKKTGSSIFSIYLPVEDCSNIDVGSNYKIRDLKNNLNMGMFNGGKVVYKEGSNVLFISPTCHLYSEGGLEGEYSYDAGGGYLVLTLYQKSDLKQSNSIKLWLRVKPLEMK